MRLLNYLRQAPWVRSMRSRYRTLFSIHEIEEHPILQWMFGGSLLFFFLTFNRWINSSNITVEQVERGAAVCWEYFQNCTDYYFLHEVGQGYSGTTFYMLLYAIMASVIYSIWRRNWVLAHALLIPLLMWEIAVTLVLSFSDGAPYYYYHVILTSLLLFVPYKEFFLKLGFVFLYFMSVTTKLDQTWVLGTYFTSLRDGLPLLPDGLTPIFTNVVIFMQMIGAWFLMSRNWILQRIAFVYFLAFHLYSGIFVFYFYPTVSLPPLLILFGPFYRHTPIPFSKKTIAGWTIIALVGVFQILGFTAPGDRRMTLEGNKFGMFMFEANHQCIVTVGTLTAAQMPLLNWEAEPGTACNEFFCRTKTVTEDRDGLTLRTDTYESGTAWNRCYPYEWWSRQTARCRNNNNIAKVSLQMDHSINGGPFYRIVDELDICDVPYNAFGDNAWIKEPPEAPAIGRPVTNTYN